MHEAWVALALTLKVAGWATALNLVLGVVSVARRESTLVLPVAGGDGDDGSAGAPGAGRRLVRARFHTRSSAIAAWHAPAPAIVPVSQVGIGALLLVVSRGRRVGPVG